MIHPYCTDSITLFPFLLTYCKSIWIKASAKCPKCKCKCRDMRAFITGCTHWGGGPYWISCSAGSLCTVGGRAPAAPTSHSSPSSWRSCAPGSPSAGVPSASRWPPPCPGRTATPGSFSGWPGSPEERETEGVRMERGALGFVMVMGSMVLSVSSCVEILMVRLEWA